jgi:hypothetical protein
MRKIVISIVAVALVAAAASLAVMSNSVAGAAKGPKPPVTAICTSGNPGGAGSQFGSESDQLVVGCVGSSSKAKITATGSIIPDVSTSSATIYWTDKKTTTESFSYAAGGTCPTFLGQAASTAVTVTATVTGGNSGLTVGQAESSVNCLYTGGGWLFVQSAGPVSF